MKLAYIYDAVHPWETGGVQRRVWELSRRLADDHNVHWYGLHYWEGPAVRETEGVTLHGVTEPLTLYTKNGRRSIREALSFSAKLARPLLNDDFDIIDCQAFPYFPCFTSKIGSLLHDTTLFVTWHEIWMEYWHEYLGRKGIFGKAVERLVAQLPDVHIAVSTRTQRDLDTLGVPDGRIVPNGIDTASIESAPVATEPIDFLFAGRLIKEKNVDLLVCALARVREAMPDFRCVIVGDGPEQMAIEQLIDDLGLNSNVTLVDFRDTHGEILGLMKAADVFVLPSRREGFGMTVLEALACGTPVVTINHPQNAAAELIDNGETGYIADATPKAVADALLAARTELSSTACAAAAEEYDWDTITLQTEKVYQEAI